MESKAIGIVTSGDVDDLRLAYNTTPHFHAHGLTTSVIAYSADTVMDALRWAREDCRLVLVFYGAANVTTTGITAVRYCYTVGSGLTMVNTDGLPPDPVVEQLPHLGLFTPDRQVDPTAVEQVRAALAAA